jgi:uncharacterized protein YjiS (DUF1127 family)
MVSRFDGDMGPIASVQSSPPGWLLAVVGLVELWLQRRGQRRTLLELNDHMLKDIGISRCEAMLEGRKPFWRG